MSAKETPRKLTPKQALFAEEYLKDLNATQAATRAGYSEKTASSQGERLLRNAEVKEAIHKAMGERSERTKMKADEVLLEFARIGQSNILDYVSFGIEGVALRDSSELTEDQARCISEVSETVNAQGVRQIKFKLHDKIRALENLARHLGLLVEKHEHSGVDGKPIEHLVVKFVKTNSKG